MKLGFIRPNLPGHLNPMTALARQLQGHTNPADYLTRSCGNMKLSRCDAEDPLEVTGKLALIREPDA